MSHLPLIAIIATVLVGNASGYGNAGHQAIGTVAEHYLVDTRALKEVRSLLKNGENLDRASTWADRAKLPEKYLTPEMKEFVTNNPDHHAFHYCDIPFQQKAYRDGVTGTNKKDIVHILEICVKVLQAPDGNRENTLRSTSASPSCSSSTLSGISTSRCTSAAVTSTSMTTS